MFGAPQVRSGSSHRGRCGRVRVSPSTPAEVVERLGEWPIPLGVDGLHPNAVGDVGEKARQGEGVDMWLQADVRPVLVGERWPRRVQQVVA